MSQTNVEVYVALGSNIEPKTGHLKQAIDSIQKIEGTGLKQQSNVYQTVPKGYSDQDDFLNMVVGLETPLTSDELLMELQKIESELKRVRTIKNGPRTIDLDILAYGSEEVNTEDLEVPHPRLQERAFVLFPFAEIAEDFTVPVLNKRVKELRDALSEAEQNDVEVKDSLNNLDG